MEREMVEGLKAKDDDYTIKVVGPARYAIFKNGQRTAYSGGTYQEAMDMIKYLTSGPRWKFTLVCPSCNKYCEQVEDHKIPEPHLNCGDCLMEKLETVSLKVAKVEMVGSNG